MRGKTVVRDAGEDEIERGGTGHAGKIAEAEAGRVRTKAVRPSEEARPPAAEVVEASTYGTWPQRGNGVECRAEQLGRRPRRLDRDRVAPRREARGRGYRASSREPRAEIEVAEARPRPPAGSGPMTRNGVSSRARAGSWK